MSDATGWTERLSGMLPMDWKANTFQGESEPRSYTALLNYSNERDWSLLASVRKSRTGDGWKASLDMGWIVVAGKMRATISVGGNSPTNALGKAIAQMREGCTAFVKALEGDDG